MYIGIDFGGTKILTALADKNGRILYKVRLDTEAKKGRKYVVQQLIRSVHMVLSAANLPISRIKSIGIGAPGPIINKSVIMSPPNLPGWKNVDLKAILQKALKRPVFVENDANAAALAEHMFGAGKGAGNMAYMTVSTGIGGGLIIDGKLYRGSNGTAGEVGHMVLDPNGPKCGCGNRGCLEALSSGPSIARAAGQKNAIMALLKAKQGNKKAKKAIENAAKNLGLGIANLNNVLDLDVVVIGGGVTNMKELIFKPARYWAKRFSMPGTTKHLKIVPAKLKNDVGAVGAIATAIAG